MLVKDYMTSGVDSIRPGSSLQDAAQMMRRHNVGVLPVCGDHGFCGTITDRDIVIRAVADGADPDRVLVSEVMTRAPLHCYDDQDIREVARIMETARIRRIPVMNRDELLVGMLSVSDLTRKREGQRLIAEVLEAVAGRHIGAGSAA